MAEKNDVFTSFPNTDPEDERSLRDAGQQEKAGIETANIIDADELNNHLAAKAKAKTAAGNGKKGLVIGTVAVVLVALIEVAVALIEVTAAMSMFADHSSVGTTASSDWKYTVSQDGTANIYKYEGDETAITIPGELDGYKVTRIVDYAFVRNYTITSVTIPDGVTSIGDAAFESCIRLEWVTIPESLISIGLEAFNGCTRLTSVIVQDSPTHRNRSSAAVVLPDSVTYIGSGAFGNCTSLTSVTLPKKLPSINGAFGACSGLTFITIPDSVTSISACEFSGCSSLKEVTIPDSVTSIWNLAFDGCSSLTSITIPDSVDFIGEGAFSGCTSLTVYAPQPASYYNSEYIGDYIDWVVR